MRFVVRSLASRFVTLRSAWRQGTSPLSSFVKHPAARASSKLLFITSLTSLPFSEESYLGKEAVADSVRVPSLRDAYEDFRERTHQILFKVRDAVDEHANSEPGKTLLTITAVNTAVYLMWKVVPSPFMLRHFSNSLESMRRARVWTLFTSNFSHMGLFHLVSNMYLLNRFGHDVVDVLGSERFYLFYGTAGVASALASLLLRSIRKSKSVSLGASGAVVATLWLHACFFPDRRMSILGLDRTVTMQELVIAYTVFDAAGLLGSFGRIDFAAHIGGTIFANTWFYLVRDKLVQEYLQKRQTHGLYSRKMYSRADRFRGYEGE